MVVGDQITLLVVQLAQEVELALAVEVLLARGERLAVGALDCEVVAVPVLCAEGVAAALAVPRGERVAVMVMVSDTSVTMAEVVGGRLWRLLTVAPTVARMLALGTALPVGVAV